MYENKEKQYLELLKNLKKSIYPSNKYKILLSKQYLQKKFINTKFGSIRKDQKKRSNFQEKELTKLIFKTYINSSTNYFFKCQPLYFFDIGSDLSLDNRFSKILSVQKSSFSKIRNRCILSGHNTSIAHLGLSRILFRKFAALGKLPGIIKNTNL